VPRRRRIGYVVAVAAVCLCALVVTGEALEGRTRRRIADRVGEALNADASIARGDLALVRGHLDLDELTARRDDLVGQLTLSVASLHCELPPLGFALVDRDCRDLVVRAPRLAVSAAALLRLEHPRHRPLHAQHIVITDARLEASPSAFLPSLGRIAIDITRAEAGDTTFKTPLSWLLSLRELRATLTLPAGFSIELSYDHGELRVSGSLLGASPVVLPVALPIADPTDDARAEIARLVAFGKDVAARLLERKAAEWLESRLPR
jgi:hypothetical protein